MAAAGAIGARKTVAISTSGAATQVIEAAVAGQIIEVDSFIITTLAAAVTDFEGSSATVLASFQNGAGVPVANSSTAPYSPLFWTARGEGLTFRSSASTATGYVTYRIVST